MHILIAPDKFKGSLTASQAAEAIRRGLARALPGASFTLVPVADGGEGTMEAFHAALGGEWITVPTRDALGRQVTGCILLTQGRDGRRLAVVETSEACGYLRIKPDERNLPRSSTHGVGPLLLAARDAGAERIIAGLGGSATNDAGMGMAAALGFRLLDANNREVEAVPSQLASVHRIIAPPDLRLPPIVAACDVANPLLGLRGATTVYGPQKGLKPADQPMLERALARAADAAEQLLGRALRDTPGAGAAGGLGFGLMAFCGATLRPGFAIVAETAGLAELAVRCDLAITGEGSLDEQTLEGKTAAGVAQLARSAGRPVIALAGRLADEEHLGTTFNAWSAITPASMPLEEALRRAPELLESAAFRLGLSLRPGGPAAGIVSPATSGRR